MSDSKNEVAWKILFDRHKIIEQINSKNLFAITATQINEEREARLMTKFDHRSQLPQIFSDNGLSILPTSRGGYIISNFETYHNFELADVPIEKVDFPSLESLDYKNITSEATAINCAFVSGILEHFLNDEDLRPTVSGRMGSAFFDFNINTAGKSQKIKVQKAQIEIDGGYEGIKTLGLIEAKNYISTDFLVRQLYYPFKLWSGKIKKGVRPIFLTYTNGVFHLREYIFDDINHYNSLRLIHQKKYSIREEPINLETIKNILLATKRVKEPEISFPQANSFERVINLCELLNERTQLTSSEITSNYDFAGRQTNYYTDAGRYLGLIEKKKEDGLVVYFLTAKGIRLFQMTLHDRQLEFVKLILSHTAFKKTLDLYFEKFEQPKIPEIAEIMKESGIYNVKSDDTYERRASSILGWIKWIIGLIEE